MGAYVTETRGYTPVIDVLVEELGTITALVYGAIWRYCQMEDGVCRASLETVGKRAGIDAKTVLRHVRVLCEHGYLEDRTPGLRGKPHTYADTGKVTLRGRVDIGHKVPTAPEEEGTESPITWDSKSVEDGTESPLKKDSKREKKNISGANAPVPADQKPRGHNAIRLALEEHFSRITGIPRPEPKTDNDKRAAAVRWYNPLRKMAEMCEWDEGVAQALITATYAYLKGRVSISAPQSLERTALAIHTGNAPGAQSRASPGQREVIVFDRDTIGGQI